MKGILVAAAAGAGLAFVIYKGSEYLGTADSSGKFPLGASGAKYAPYIVGAAAAVALHKFMPSAV